MLWLACILLVVLGGLGTLVFFSFDTQYAPGYSERGFKSIQLGDSEALVISQLGQPFSTRDTEPYVSWIYSAGKQRNFSRNGQGVGTYTTIQFDATSRVTAIGGQVQESAGSFTFGDGLNFLKLDEARIKELKGCHQDEIQRQFGPPVARYSDSSARLLRYSRSPSSANYHLRVIGVDKDGKVVKIWREIYWD